MKIVDPGFVDAVLEDEARKVVMVAVWCVQEDPAMRPAASAMSQMLEGHIKIQEKTMPSLQSTLSRQRQIWITVISIENREAQN